jgi:hypothetical protein
MRSSNIGAPALCIAAQMMVCAGQMRSAGARRLRSERPMRQLISLSAKAAITAALLYFALGRTDFGLIGARLNRLEFGWMLLAVLWPPCSLC